MSWRVLLASLSFLINISLHSKQKNSCSCYSALKTLHSFVASQVIKPVKKQAKSQVTLRPTVSHSARPGIVIILGLTAGFF